MIELIAKNEVTVTTDFSDEFEIIAERKAQDVLDVLAEGGRPPWEKTKRGAIPRLYDRFESQIETESDEVSAKVKVGGSPDTFLHHFGGEVFQEVTNRQRAFFWREFYDTGDDMWKYMALSKTLHSHHPARTLAEWYDEDSIWIADILGDAVFQVTETQKQAQRLN